MIDQFLTLEEDDPSEDLSDELQLFYPPSPSTTESSPSLQGAQATVDDRIVEPISKETEAEDEKQTGSNSFVEDDEHETSIVGSSPTIMMDTSLRMSALKFPDNLPSTLTNQHPLGKVASSKPMCFVSIAYQFGISAQLVCIRNKGFSVGLCCGRER